MKSIKEIINGFLAGFFNGGTPFSAKKKKKLIETKNPLRNKAEELLESRNFEEEDIIDSICYFSGGILGCIIAPIDAIMVIYGNIKESIKIK